MNKTGGLINQCLCAVILCLWGAVECRGETLPPAGEEGIMEDFLERE